MRIALFAVMIALAGCAAQREAPSCSGSVFAVNPAEAPR